MTAMISLSTTINIVSHRVHYQIQLAPDSPLYNAMFPDFPLAFNKHFQADQVDNQVGDVFLSGLPVWHCHSAGPLANTTVIGGTKRYVYQLEQKVEPLLSCLQSETEHSLEHQGRNGLVSVKLTAAPPPVIVMVEPAVHDFGINPEGE